VPGLKKKEETKINRIERSPRISGVYRRAFEMKEKRRYPKRTDRIGIINRRREREQVWLNKDRTVVP